MARKSRAGGKSKAESVTGKKAGEAEMRKVGQNELPICQPDDFKFHMASIKGFMEKATTANAALRNAIKSAKKVNPHLPAIIKEALALERNDPAEKRAYLENLGMALKEIGAPFQLGIFDIAQDPLVQAKREGLEDGKAGRPASNKYVEGSAPYAEYMAGWQEGQGLLLGLNTPKNGAGAQAAA